ncbi:hypothetical protein M409DRAFT_28293 [Zasmidium cellare ATCC 36951]|uniref:Tat pathway signal sequence n=1 Tax=Zasmidium cellare ATCC 36951 TaxID=1080233 RepID=A0A6A6C2D5_ZASCE|nr:uncharacterized protein M409DRAFT_28293 [Zasmidium cellare ATCC 36951]KAF2161254.1 hypothetical protein M409DRAFT_28293 [Zasmidium cellare ATCC 36951]
MRTLHQPEDEELLADDSSALLTSLKTVLRQKSRTIKLQWAAIGLLLLTIPLVSVLSRSEQRCSELLFAPSPALESVLDHGYHEDVINGSTHYHSRWQGHPNEDLDAAWHDIVNEGLMKISFEQAESLGKSLDQAVQVPPDLLPKYGEGIVVSSDMAHELHCLNMIRMYTHQDYYRSQPQVPLLFRQNNENVLRKHIDHCIDVLRQNLMCTVDTSLITHRWIDGRPLMQPDFNVKKKCRSFDAMMNWIETHEIKELNRRPGYGVPRDQPLTSGHEM